MEESLRLSQILKDNGVDLITASGGGFVNVDQNLVKPGYQLPMASQIKKVVRIPVATVGMISDARHADDIIKQGDADLVVIAREHLRNPYFATNAAIELGETIELPWQYKRGYN
jgi:2,4-dienoyl-CoA reductase-like NADH-dependent reductase (Old Yellow Enzyme family)